MEATRFRVVYGDNKDQIVEPWPKDIKDFESEFPVTVVELGPTNMRYEWICWLAHRGAKRVRGGPDVPDSLDDWLDTVKDIQPVVEAPTVPLGPSPEPSPS